MAEEDAVLRGIRRRKAGGKGWWDDENDGLYNAIMDVGRRRYGIEDAFSMHDGHGNFPATHLRLLDELVELYERQVDATYGTPAVRKFLDVQIDATFKRIKATQDARQRT